MTLISLCLTFTGFGLLCFGGGYMLVPLLVSRFVRQENLITIEEFGNLLSVSQLTPGPIGINAATYIGFISDGIPGAIAGTLGLILPSLSLGCLAVVFLHKYRDSAMVRGILTGLKPAALAMIFYASFIFLEVSVFTAEIPWRELFSFALPENFGISWRGCVVTAVSIVLMTVTRLPVMAVIFTGALLGAILSVI